MIKLKYLLTYSLLTFSTANGYSNQIQSIDTREKLITNNLEGSCESIDWEDLKIQKLLPDYIVFPSIDPYLPENFIGQGDGYLTFWGTKENLDAILNSEDHQPKSAVICAVISSNVEQIGTDTFSDEGLMREDFLKSGCKNIEVKKWKWGDHPVMTSSTQFEGKEMRSAWIGLNHQGQVLFLCLLLPNQGINPSKSDLDLWTNFLEKTRPLDQYEFLKSKGQDMRAGVTLVNLYGSVLKITAEKRIRDGKIQAVIRSEDPQFSCNCMNISESRIGPGGWHSNEPILKIQAQLELTGKANIISQNHINILLKSVPEFSIEKGDVTYKKDGEIAIYNHTIKGQASSLTPTIKQ